MKNPQNSRQNSHFPLIVLTCLFLIVAGFANFHNERSENRTKTDLENKLKLAQQNKQMVLGETNETAIENAAQDSMIASGETTEAETFTDPSPNPNVIALEASTDDQTAFQLLLASGRKLDYKQYDFGIFIQGIGDLMSDDKNYWAVYLNGEYASASADNLILKAGDKVEFRYEAVEQN